MRQATTKFGTEITLPPEVKSQPGMGLGDEVDVLYDNFVLIVPKGTTVDEERLRGALLIPSDSPEGAAPQGHEVPADNQGETSGSPEEG